MNMLGMKMPRWFWVLVAIAAEIDATLIFLYGLYRLAQTLPWEVILHPFQVPPRIPTSFVSPDTPAMMTHQSNALLWIILSCIVCAYGKYVQQKLSSEKNPR